MRGLDDIQTLEENKANMLGRTIERVVFPEGVYRQDRDGGDVSCEELRWSSPSVVVSRIFVSGAAPKRSTWASRSPAHVSASCFVSKDLQRGFMPRRRMGLPASSQLTDRRHCDLQ